MLSSLSKKSRAGFDVDQYLQPVPEELGMLMRQPQERCKPRRRRRVMPPVPEKSTSAPDLSSVPPPASQDAQAAAAAVMARVTNAQEMPRSISLPQLRRAGPPTANRSGAGSSRYGRDAQCSESSFQCSVAASSVAATRKGMRRLYKSKHAELLPALVPSAPAKDRDLRSALTGASCHRRQVDACMKPRRCEDLLSQNYERAIFEKYYS